jgi:hypothetical protein
MVPAVLLIPERSKAVKTPSIDLSQGEVVVIKGFEREDIEVSVDQLETRIMPESLAGFLE